MSNRTFRLPWLGVGHARGLGGREYQASGARFLLFRGVAQQIEPDGGAKRTLRLQCDLIATLCPAHQGLSTRSDSHTRRNKSQPIGVRIKRELGSTGRTPDAVNAP